MPISIEEAKDFIESAKKVRDPWLTMADRSWAEIKKRQRNGRLWSVTPNSLRRRMNYPIWNNIFNIRKPIILSRIGIPIGKDTTEDGSDTVGGTAAIALERLAKGLVKEFPFFDVMCDSRDDFLATNFGICRAYYQKKDIKEQVKEYITPEQNPITGEWRFVDSAGKPIDSDDIGQDESGYFYMTDRVVDIENEMVCLEPVVYKRVYVDADVERWHRVNRIGFECHYSEREFVEIFGAKILAQLPRDIGIQAASSAQPERKKKTIRVFEIWDKIEGEVVWYAANYDKLIKPKAYYMPDEFEESEQPNGLYDLRCFYPSPKPLMMNQPTDEFWPIPEYYQLMDVLEDVHTIFSRMAVLTRSIRSRLLFDSSITGLQAALNELAEADAIGVPNLGRVLTNAGGSLDAVVQYLPVEKMIEGLSQMYGSLEQRLNTIYRLTGTSDLLQGYSADPQQRTLGERQMTEKYALNQIAEAQRKMQEYVRDCYELLCEMALKNFKDETLDRYIMPQSMTPDQQQNYRASISLLRSNNGRFRIELETDSTIALNEEYDKAMRVELVNALTTALEKTANIATQSPALVVTELHCLKFLIQGFRQGKLFQNEVTQAIDAVIKQAEAAQQSISFNPAEAAQQFKERELNADIQLKLSEIQSRERIEAAKLQTDQLEKQIEMYKINTEAQSEAEDRAVKMQELQAEIAEGAAKIALSRDELIAELTTAEKEHQIKLFGADFEQRLAQFDMMIRSEQQKLAEYKVMLDEKEKYLTEQRLQSEHDLNLLQQRIELANAAQPKPPAPPDLKKKIKVTRDEMGFPQSFELEGGGGYRVIRDEFGEIQGYESL